MFSIFISPIKIYVPLFVLNILFFVYVIIKDKIKIKLNTWRVSLLGFIIWTIVNTGISIGLNGHIVNYQEIIKILLNLTFLFVTSIVIDNKVNGENDERLIKFLEIIIVLNFVQILFIYVYGGLFVALFTGTLTTSSDSAYIISNFKNIIGADSKNIWASKFTFFYIVYLYISTKNKDTMNVKRKYIYIFLGLFTVVLLLSRTAQIAAIIAVIFFLFVELRLSDFKYKKYVYYVTPIIILSFLVVFFNKFFHIKFDMTDGGFTRLLIWKEFFNNLFNTNFIVGNGVGYSKIFINNVLMRSESNLHNVFLNLLFEMGIIGCGFYVMFLFNLFKGNIKNMIKINAIFILVIPFLFMIFLQYMGYDNDLVVFFILIILCSFNTKKEMIGDE
jgi:O-antigen ligase